MPKKEEYEVIAHLPRGKASDWTLIERIEQELRDFAGKARSSLELHFTYPQGRDEYPSALDARIALGASAPDFKETELWLSMNEPKMYCFVTLSQEEEGGPGIYISSQDKEQAQALARRLQRAVLGTLASSGDVDASFYAELFNEYFSKPDADSPVEGEAN